jgi:hypothetical protein
LRKVESSGSLRAMRLAGRILDHGDRKGWQVWVGSDGRSRRYRLRAGRAELSRAK